MLDFKLVLQTLLTGANPLMLAPGFLLKLYKVSKPKNSCPPRQEFFIFGYYFITTGHLHSSDWDVEHNNLTPTPSHAIFVGPLENYQLQYSQLTLIHLSAKKTFSFYCPLKYYVIADDNQHQHQNA